MAYLQLHGQNPLSRAAGRKSQAQQPEASGPIGPWWLGQKVRPFRPTRSASPGILPNGFAELAPGLQIYFTLLVASQAGRNLQRNEPRKPCRSRAVLAWPQKAAPLRPELRPQSGCCQEHASALMPAAPAVGQSHAYQDDFHFPPLRQIMAGSEPVLHLCLHNAGG